MVQVYLEAARKRTQDAEDLVCQALVLREEAQAMMDRAGELMYMWALGRDQDEREAAHLDDGIDW